MSEPSATGQTRRRRWPAVLAVVVGLVAAVALVAAIFTPDRGSDPQPAPTTPPASSPSPSAAIANGCLGGAADLDQAVLTAQQEAPLTEVGAAEFAATYLRWATSLPAPESQAATAEQVWSSDATAAVRDLSSPLVEGGGTIGRGNVLEGVYYVEEFSAERAVVTVLVTVTGTTDGQSMTPVEAPVELTLTPTDAAAWHVQDIGGSRTVEDIKAIGTPFAGGC